ncbi:response regulator transcription factor [Bradyrhizobium japonicum]|uniref:response regulator transcription factor n=1 Tax=Bradyrhizobium japonicum TaxID=375 RepID=UPI001BA70B07|nr:response regulator transcription factor [Bradyrhizobium japonicum]MBR0804369.1 response regulator transcription factor [Bradyrhizobium japonicum]
MLPDGKGGVLGLRIVVYSPVRLFCEGVAACLEGDATVEAAICCHMAGDLVETVTGFAIDVVLVDVAQQSGLAEGRALASACPDVSIVALALGDASADVIDCADAGFISYVPRDAPISQLRAIIDMAMRGEVQCGPKVSGALLRELRSRQRKALEDQSSEPLTRRECGVLRLVGRGLSNKEIAQQLGVSEATIKNHVHGILAKLRVRRRAQAAARFRDQPWIARIG